MKYAGMFFAAGGLLASIAYAAASGTRLTNPVTIGQKSTITETITFDVGHGGSNPTITANPSSNLLSLSTPAAVASEYLGVSGGSYPTIGYNTETTTTTNQYNKLAADTASMVRFTSGGLQLYGDATSGTGLITAGAGNFSLLLTVNSSGDLSAGAGTVGSPAYSFTDDTATGLILGAASDLGFVAGGAQHAHVTTSGLSADALQTNSGGFFKVRVFTGTLATAGGLVTLTAPSGVILSVTGWGQHDATSAWRPILPSIGGSIAGDVFINNSGTTSTAVVLENGDSNGSHADSAYRVIMIYQ